LSINVLAFARVNPALVAGHAEHRANFAASTQVFRCFEGAVAVHAHARWQQLTHVLQINLLYFDVHEKAKNEMYESHRRNMVPSIRFTGHHTWGRFGLGCSTLTWAPLSGLEGDFSFVRMHFSASQ
jgi:hypothetical protein